MKSFDDILSRAKGPVNFCLGFFSAFSIGNIAALKELKKMKGDSLVILLDYKHDRPTIYTREEIELSLKEHFDLDYVHITAKSKESAYTKVFSQIEATKFPKGAHATLIYAQEEKAEVEAAIKTGGSSNLKLKEIPNVYYEGELVNERLILSLFHSNRVS